MANRLSSSASPTLPSGRPNSSVLADDCTLDTHTFSSQGASRLSKYPSHANVARAEKFRRKGSSRALRSRRSAEASGPMPNYHYDRGGFAVQKSSNEGTSGRTRGAGYSHDDGTPSRPPPSGFSGRSPVAGLSTREEDGPHDRMQMENDLSPDSEDTPMDESDSGSRDLMETDSDNTPFRQPETNPITEEQLINEVRAIYAGLVMVEKKCIEVDKRQSESRADLSDLQWQSMISLHRTLLYEHHDFFLASQHPSASPVLQRLAEKYAMPARMWRYGIHSFLELLRQKLPDSLDYMLNFIYLAYSMMTLLLESVKAFRETWIECLGDLARYRMAVEESDMGDREVWAGVSRYWYNQYADRSSDIGRIQHHLAVLARPDAIQQLFYYTKALVSVQPFLNARDSIVLLFNPYHGQPLDQHNMATAFIAAHGVLFTRKLPESYVPLANRFLSLLRGEVRRLGRQGQQGVYMMSCNFASILQYGDREAFMKVEFSQKPGDTAAEALKFALEWTAGTASDTISNPTDLSLQIPAQVTFQGSCLAFHTLNIFLDQMGDPNIYPSIHISLAFVWCLALHPPAMQQLEKMIPWLGISKFLNTLFRPDIVLSKVEGECFPLVDDGTTQQLPEDFLIRGQAWSQLYYPEHFFRGAPSEDDRPVIEEASTVIPRKHRCLWLGRRIATFGRWITYSQALKFEATPLAHEFAPVAETCGDLNSKAPPTEPHSDLNNTSVA
ncbi:DNA/RNA-binding domain E.t1.c1-type [Penicillium hispanicum]|uniref:DNA/RNA-binding domain E.t1.c1-type n=1 Tax=Penicillium hispanicum TaxID=1080232 RepID=UPI002541B3C3|nr:DNA/RNA-binding domain E.t1.c1-type [Penicillium hispanicum]KAJ5573912.1 DNA/RNA-binding domain E.t1.c1-type [Penicillium hispanicum]